MMMIYQTMWQEYPASGVRDLLDYLLSLGLTAEEQTRGCEYLDPPLAKLCNIDNCGGSVLVRGMCSPHYQQWRYRNRRAKQSD